MNRLSNQARLALATLCLAAVATVAAVIGAGWWAHERALSAGEEAIRQSVLLLDRSVDRAMDSLNSLVNEIEHDILNYEDGQAAASDLLAVQVVTSDHVVLAEIVGADNRVVLATHPARIGQLRTDLPSGLQATLPPAGPAIPLRRLTISRAAPVTDPDDPLTGTAGLIAINIATADMVGTIYVVPTFFRSAISNATTWKNQTAELIQPDGTRLTGGQASWLRELHPLALTPQTGTAADFTRPSHTMRSDDWLIGHRLLPHLGVHIATGVPQSTVLQGWHADLMVAILIGFGVLVILGVLAIITVRIDRKNRMTEAALQEMTERLNLAFDGSNDGVWDWNTETDRAYYSPRWCRLLGYGASDIAAKPQSWMNLLHPDDRVEVCTAINDHLEGKTPVYSAVHRMRRKDDGWLWVESRGKALRAPDGRAYRMVGTMTDIEEKKRQELALLAARDEAEAANRIKSEFLAVMSHEIRTPMSGVLGMTQVLLNTALTTKQRRFAELIRSSGESLLAILNDILDFSKLDAGHFELEQLDFCLNDEIDAVTRLMEAPARAKGIALHFDDRTGGRIALRGDPTRIRQILINLIGNAIKFTEEGSVTLRCRANARADGEYEVRFEVIDTGIGMTETVRANLFQKFNQGDPSIARRYGGTGLGLAICQQLTALMNGTIRVESQPNVGSRFCVTVILPKANAVPHAAAEPLATARRPELSSLRVLAAEDNEVNQVLLHELLAAHVRTLDIVGDGEAAISAAKKKGYDVVLMDVRLPGIDGVSAAQEIRRLGGTWETRPIIALTANAMTEQHAAYLDAGMTACLSKPIDCDKLYGMLSRIAAEGLPSRRREGPVMSESEQPAEVPAASAPAEQPHPLLAEEGLAQLVAMIGGDSVSALMQQLAKQLRESMQQLHDCDEEPAVLSAVAHTLAGAAGNCQAVRVSRAARALENAVNQGAEVAPRMAALQEAVDLTLPAIDAMVTRLADEPTPAPMRAIGY